MKKLPREIVILGAGSHARVVIAALREAGSTVSKCIAPEPPNALWSSEIQWLGGDEELAHLDQTRFLLVNGIGSITVGHERRSIFEHACNAGFEFASLKHPSAIVDESVQLGEGAQIMAGAVI